MKRLLVRHRSEFRYSVPVTLLAQRFMLRPRDSHVCRLLDAWLAVTPTPSLRWEYDVFGNSVAIARFAAATDQLVVDSSILIEHYGTRVDAIDLDPIARHVPLVYPAEEAQDLAPFLARSRPDPDRVVEAWARRFLGERPAADTLEILSRMTVEIGRGFAYAMRFDAGTQAPAETLARGSGTCRDFAALMMDALRALGVATRFVSGYLSGPADGAPGRTPTGHPHAWVEAYLPGAGWVEFDPTNGLAGSDRLIRVAVARDADQAMPIRGAFIGPPGACIHAAVAVDIDEADPMHADRAAPTPRAVA